MGLSIAQKIFLFLVTMLAAIGGSACALLAYLKLTAGDPWFALIFAFEAILAYYVLRPVWRYFRLNRDIHENRE